jgi:predicted small secreted protein
MKKPVSVLAIFLPTALFVAGCKNPVDGLTDISLNFNERVTIAAKFENGSGLPTIGNLRVVWDGETLQELTPSTPVDQITVSGSRFGRERGSHRLSFRIASQTSSPNTYRVTGLLITSYDEAGAVVGTLALDPRTELLATNDAIDYDFRL